MNLIPAVIKYSCKQISLLLYKDRKVDMENLTGKRIEMLREEKGWSKKYLADLLGMKSYTSVTKWENGNNLPRGLELIKLAQKFEVSSDYILGLSDKR